MTSKITTVVDVCPNHNIVNHIIRTNSFFVLYEIYKLLIFDRVSVIRSDRCRGQNLIGGIGGEIEIMECIYIIRF